MTAEDWKQIKASTACSGCDDKGWYMGYKDPECGIAMKRYRCGCAYPDAWKTGHYPPRIPKQNACLSHGEGEKRS